MEIRWQGSKWEGTVSLFYYFNTIFIHLLSPTSAVYSQKLPARSLAMAQMIEDMSPYPIPCAILRLVAICWIWVCLCKQAVLSLPVLSHPCKLSSLHILSCSVEHTLPSEGWQGRGWTLLTSLNLDKTPLAALQQRIPGGNRWLCQLVAFRHPIHPPAPALSAQWCLHQLRMTQGQGWGDRGQFPITACSAHKPGSCAQVALPGLPRGLSWVEEAGAALYLNIIFWVFFPLKSVNLSLCQVRSTTDRRRCDGSIF